MSDILKTGEIVKSIISWIREIRNKYNIPKEKLTLYIDLYSKESLSSVDIELIRWENMIMKSNMGNLDRIEYSLYELFNENAFFEATQIEGISLYIPLLKIDKKEKTNSLLEEISRLENQIAKCDLKLLNEKFIEKATIETILSERKKKADFTFKISSLRSILVQLECGKQQYDLLIKFGSIDNVTNQILYFREKKTTEDLYSQKWISEIYDQNIKTEEILELYNLVFLDKT